jgi:hypothetical protein
MSRSPHEVATEVNALLLELAIAANERSAAACLTPLRALDRLVRCHEIHALDASLIGCLEADLLQLRDQLQHDVSRMDPAFEASRWIGTGLSLALLAALHLPYGLLPLALGSPFVAWGFYGKHWVTSFRHVIAELDKLVTTLADVRTKGAAPPSPAERPSAKVRVDAGPQQGHVEPQGHDAPSATAVEGKVKG